MSILSDYMCGYEQILQYVLTQCMWPLFIHFFDSITIIWSFGFHVCSQFILKEPSNEASVCLFLSWMSFSFNCCGVKIRWISVRSWSCNRNVRNGPGAKNFKFFWGIIMAVICRVKIWKQTQYNFTLSAETHFLQILLNMKTSDHKILWCTCNDK